MPIIEQSIAELLVQIQQHTLSAQTLVDAYLEQIAQQESQVQAWEYFDPLYVQQQAERIDRLRFSGMALGRLAGIPVGIKDIFVTQDMPTGWGTPIHAGRYLNKDAAVVERLRLAGAILMGKTVTTEYATARAGKTRNPHNLKHTPGGSSSGSAAAVAARMVPVAIGSQTLGSILRPAAYCGVIGFKPSFGLISRYGAMPASRELDHVGLFARSIADLELLCSVLAGSDQRDPDCTGSWPARDNPVRKVAVIRTNRWSEISAEAQEHFKRAEQMIQVAGIEVEPVDLSAEFDNSLSVAQVLMSAGLAANHGSDYDQHANQMSPAMQQWIERGRRLSAVEYATARQETVDYCIQLAKILSEQDAILTPVTTGPAPIGLENTGSPQFCALWTLCGLPAISLPVGRSASGLPLAVQLVGRRRQDADLLEFAARIQPQV